MQQYYRQATPEEITFYQETLYPLQDAVMGIAALYEAKIYLTGGTALARFHFQHRLSEDLDFFVRTDDLKLIVTDLLSRLEGRGFTARVEQLDVYFARFFVLQQEVALKIDFVRDYHLTGPLLPVSQGVFTNTLEDIGANKVTAFEDRAEIKDIVDLFYITQQVPLERLFALADQKRIPIAYEHLLTINTQGISGRALLTRPLAAAELAAFVTELQQQTETEVKKKEQIASEQLEQVIARLLWDFPRPERQLTSFSQPVIRRRIHHLPLPERRALAKAM